MKVSTVPTPDGEEYSRTQRGSGSEHCGTSGQLPSPGLLLSVVPQPGTHSRPGSVHTLSLLPSSMLLGHTSRPTEGDYTRPQGPEPDECSRLLAYISTGSLAFG